MGVLLGYSEVGYRVLLHNKIVVSRNVEIIEKDTKCIGSIFEPGSEGSSDSDSNKTESEDSEYFSNNEESEKENRKEEEINSQNELRRSTRTKRSPIRYPKLDETSTIIANVCRLENPQTFEEAMNSAEKNEWAKAMDREIEVLNKNKTWKLVEKNEDKQAIDVKWVYNRKTGGKYKARLVVRGFQQKEQLDDLYAPVAKIQTLKTLLAYCCQYELNIRQMDVEAAFLNGTERMLEFVLMHDFGSVRATSNFGISFSDSFDKRKGAGVMLVHLILSGIQQVYVVAFSKGSIVRLLIVIIL
ncbi:hypothetical protein TKK_0017291 [Trichogramma kaykai]